MFKKMILLSIIVISAGFCANLLFPSISNAMVVNKTQTLTNSLNDDLIEWLTFDAKKKSGATFTATVGNNGTGTVTKGATGILGQSVDCDGTNSVIAVTVPTSTIQTFSFWIKPHNIPTDNSKGIMAAPILYFGVNTGKLIVYPYSSGYSTGVASLSANKWYHIILSIEIGPITNTSTVYINGVLDKIGAAAAASAATSKSLCQYISIRRFDGQMDDFRVYNRYLNINEIKQLYKMGGGKVNKSPSVTTNLNTSLISWWTFDAKETTITTTTDKSGSGSNGRRFGITNSQIGKIGQGMYFNGTTGYVISSGNTITGSNKFTLAAWVKVKAFKNDYGGVLAVGSGTTGNSAYIGLQSSNALGGGLWGTNLSTGITPELNKWYHLAEVYGNDGKLRLYVNGVLRGTPTAATPNITGANVSSGRIITSYYLNGTVDDARVYSRALSAAEIYQLYKQGAGTVNKTQSVTTNLNTGLVGWWTFDAKKESTTTSTDSSTSANDLIKSGNKKPAVGKIGQGMYFDGNGDYFSRANAALNNFSFGIGDFSISQWFKVSSIPSASAYMLGRVNSLPYWYTYITTAGKFGAYFRTVSASTGDASTATVTDNKWHHGVAVYDRDGYLKVYVDGTVNSNGVDISSYSAETTDNTNMLRMGASGAGTPSSLYTGYLDDVRVYNRALSAAEIYQLYKMGK